MYNIYWGDMHCNIRDRHMSYVDKTYEEASNYLDFFPIAYYPFLRYTKKGLSIETCTHHPVFDEHWEKIRQCVKKWNKPGRFVTFLGYEWHGNRTFYGDHNVIYFNDDAPLNPVWSLLDLYNFLRKEKGIAIPHHTAYQVGQRGKNWDYFDCEISPFAEIFSSHGSSEGCDTPIPMSKNPSMGPRTSGGSIQDGLKRGYHFGIICSGDNHNGFAGVWGAGLMAVYAKELTRESLWDAFVNRRVYGVSGDRIKLGFEVNGSLMGSIIDKPSDKAEIKVSVKASSDIDRIEILRNNKVVHTYCHQGKWNDKVSLPKVRFKQRITFGWGPWRKDGYTKPNKHWNGWFDINGGKILSVEPCFTTLGQSYSVESENKCSWNLVTKGPGTNQALIIEIEADPQAVMSMNINGRIEKRTVSQAFEQSNVIALVEECKANIQKVLGIKPDEVENIDMFYHNAYKVKLHKAVPEGSYVKEIEWTDNDIPKGENYYYVRVSQVNGQRAWSSPVWIRR